MSKWTQPICRQCYNEIHPGRIPVAMVDAEEEKCCVCGKPTIAGIYYRVDPTTVAFPK